MRLQTLYIVKLNDTSILQEKTHSIQKRAKFTSIYALYCHMKYFLLYTFFNAT
jgi:hypothetical protein